MDSTEALKDYAKEKVERIKKYFPDPISGHVILSTERGYQHTADVLIQLHNGLTIKGHEATEDMYSSIDLVMAKIERQVRRYKEKIRSHKEQQHLGEVPIIYKVVADQSEEADGKLPKSKLPAVPPELQIVKEAKFFAKPLTAEDAVMQMNLLGNSFLVFKNATSGQVNVVYRRDDGNYGLIETGSGEESTARAEPPKEAKKVKSAEART